MIECPEILNSWPIILTSGAVGVVIGFLIGFAHAVRRVERMARGGRRRMQL